MAKNLWGVVELNTTKTPYHLSSRGSRVTMKICPYYYYFMSSSVVTFLLLTLHNYFLPSIQLVHSFGVPSTYRQLISRCSSIRSQLNYEHGKLSNPSSNGILHDKVRQVGIRWRRRRWETILSLGGSDEDIRSNVTVASLEFLPDLNQITRRHLLSSLLLVTSAATTVPPGLFGVSQATAAEKKQNDSNGIGGIAIIKPPLDNRVYEAYTLPKNGLRVLLCSDPTSTSVAAAMDVHVGACSDPDTVPGLAHFNEHMLFLGTEQYPAESGFSAFLAANGGNSNAFTDTEDTVYYYNMEGEGGVYESLKRFGSFFSSPLFTESATERELNAIESENAKNLQSDTFRIYQIQKERANRRHPFSKFFTGNKKTLLEGTKSQGINLRQELLKFYETYYSANQMTLALVAPQSVETLKSYVTDIFSSVPNRNNRTKPEESWAGIPPFLDGTSEIPSTGYIVEIVPVQDLRQITLSWPIVYANDEEKETILLAKPDFYVAHLLGHEGPGSLLSFLKRRGWANGLAASTNENLSDFFTFDVTVDLTTKGLKEWDDVVEAVFSYLAMLHAERIPNYVFDEVLQLSELEWRFLSKGDPGNYVQSLAQSMQKYDAALYIAGPRRLALRGLQDMQKPRTAFSSREDREWTRSASLNLLGHLLVDSVMITVLSKTFSGKTQYREKWYGTEYNVNKIPQSFISLWSNPQYASDIGMFLPSPNIFIPSEKGLRLKPGVKREDSSSKTFEERMTPITPPHVIRDDGPEGRWTVHYKKDDRFGLPKAFAVFQLLTSDVYSTSTRATLAMLYSICAQDSLNEYVYDANMAGLTYDVQVLPRGIRLTVGGYNEKLKDFAAYVVKRLARDLHEVLPKSEDEFNRYKDRLTRELAAFDVKQPYSHAIYYSALTLYPQKFKYANDEMRKALDAATLQQLQSYVRTLWSSGKGEALIQGNIEEAEALELVDTLDSTIAFDTISRIDIPPRLKALPLPTVVTKLQITEPNLDNQNSATQVVIQCLSKSEKDHVLIELLSSVLEEPFYEDLRTTQQLGYIVSSGVKGFEETRNLNLVVQSSVAPAEKLTGAILLFLEQFRQSRLESLSEKDISSFVKGLLDSKLEPDKILSAEVTRNWSEISYGRFQFDRIQREAAALLEVTKEDLLEFWDKYFAADATEGRRMIVTELVPQSGPASSRSPPKSVGYKSRSSIKSALKRGELTLGIEDIYLFRMDREKDNNVKLNSR